MRARACVWVTTYTHTESFIPSPFAALPSFRGRTLQNSQTSKTVGIPVHHAPQAKSSTAHRRPPYWNVEARGQQPTYLMWAPRHCPNNSQPRRYNVCHNRVAELHQTNGTTPATCRERHSPSTYIVAIYIVRGRGRGRDGPPRSERPRPAPCSAQNSPPTQGNLPLQRIKNIIASHSPGMLPSMYASEFLATLRQIAPPLRGPPLIRYSSCQAVSKHK